MLQNNDMRHIILHSMGKSHKYSLEGKNADIESTYWMILFTESEWLEGERKAVAGDTGQMLRLYLGPR